MTKKITFNEITIIGPGLIGSSLGLSLKSKKLVKKIVGIDISKENLKYALKNKSIDLGRKKIDKRISNSDIIFICTPVSLVDEILREIIPFVSKKNLITDTGSVKNIFETQTVKKICEVSNFIPGHPIAGTEHSGAKYALKNLFIGKWCILTPINKSKDSIIKISNLWEAVGMKMSIMSANDHDKIMSITSHLPHLIAFTIVNTAFGIEVKKKKNLLISQLEVLETLQELVHQTQKCGQIFFLKIKNM